MGITHRRTRTDRAARGAVEVPLPACLTFMPSVFLSYAHADAEQAQRLYDDLTRAGVDVWLDRESLLPGQQWKPAIESAIRTTRYFLALLSTVSVSRRGYVNRELAIALEALDEFPSDDVYVIPARLEACAPSHPRLRDLHWVDLYPDWDRGVAKILKVIGAAAPPRSSESPPTERQTDGRERTPPRRDPVRRREPERAVAPRPRWRGREKTLRVLKPAAGYALAVVVGVVFAIGPLLMLGVVDHLTALFWTILTLAELSSATVAGWAVRRIRSISRPAGVVVVAATWLSILGFVVSLSSTRESGYTWIMMILGGIYVLIGGAAVDAIPRGDLRAALGSMAVLGFVLCAMIWLPDVTAPAPPFALEEAFSDPGLYDAVLSPDGNRLASLHSESGKHYQAKLWDRKPRTLATTIDLPDWSFADVRFSADGRRLILAADTLAACFFVACTRYPRARIWDTQSGREVATIRDSASGDGFLPVISPDGALVAFSGERSVRLWSGLTGTLARELPGPARSLQFAPNGRLVVVMPDSFHVSVWDAQTGQRVSSVSSAPRPITAVALSADGRMLGTGSVDGSVSVWNAGSGALLKRMIPDTASAPIGSISFSSDARLVATTSADTTARLWDVGQGSWTFTWKAERLEFVSRSGLVVTYDGQDFSVWGAEKAVYRQSLHFPRGFWGRTPGLTISADGGLVVVDGSVVSIFRNRSKATASSP